MLYTFEGWFCSAKLLDFPFFAIALFCTVQFWKHRVSICVSVTCKSLKQSHMNSSPRHFCIFKCFIRTFIFITYLLMRMAVLVIFHRKGNK